MANFEIKLDRRFYTQAKPILEGYNLEVGVILDGPHKNAAKGVKSLAGGPSRKIGRTSSGITIAEVSEKLRKQTGINFYTQPFKSKQNRDILKFTQEFFKVCLKKGDPKRLANTLQAIVRNPITRGDYGKNSPVTAKIKGFNRLMIDTGQLFKSIRAKVHRVSK